MKLLTTLAILLLALNICQAATLYYQDFSNSSPVSNEAANNPILDDTPVTTMVVGEVITGGSSAEQSTNGDYSITIDTVSVTHTDSYRFNEVGDAGFKYDDARYTFETGSITFEDEGVTYSGTIKLQSICNVGNEFFSINSVELVQDDATGDVYVDVDFNYYADTEPTQTDSLLLTLNFGINDVSGLEIEELIGVALGGNTTGAGVYRHSIVEVPDGARYTYQAEDMSLTGYTVGASNIAEGGEYVQTGGTGNASIVFSGVAGTYTIDTYYFDETDGQSTYELRVDNVRIDAWIADGTNGTAGVSEASKAIFRSSEVVLQTNSVIEVTSTRSNGEFGRLDQIALNAEYFTEAESMTLDGFSVQTLADASGGQMIQLSAASGKANTTIGSIVSGYYDIETVYFDESDGKAVYKIFVDGVLVDAWSANLQLGLPAPDASNLVRHQTRRVYLSSGQTLELLAYADIGEFCRTDSIRLRKSVGGASRHSMTWNGNGTIASLQLSGLEQLSAQTGLAELRIFNGDDIRSWDMINASEQNSVVELVDESQENVKMYFRIEEYEHHLLLRLIGVEQLPLYDNSLNIRVTMPIANNVNIVALDDNAEAVVSGSSIQLDWTKLGDRKHFPGGVFALYADGSTAENDAAVAEINELHVSVSPVAVSNSQPLADAQAVVVDTDDFVAITLGGSDSDGDSLSFYIVSAPSNGVLSGVTPNLSYTPTPSYTGLDSFTFVVYDGNQYSLDATVSISVGPLTALEGWRFTNFGHSDASGDAADSANPDSDSLVNLLEFAFGTDPNVNDAVELSLDGTAFTPGMPKVNVDFAPLNVKARFIRRVDHASSSMSYTAQFSHDLTIWEDLDGSNAVRISGILESNGYEAVEMNYPLFLSNGRKARFFRMQVNETHSGESQP